VRIVHAKVVGVDASEVALDGATLVPKFRGFVVAPPLDSSPRLGSEADDDDDAEDYWSNLEPVDGWSDEELVWDSDY
jgi:hypothetical protein